MSETDRGASRLHFTDTGSGPAVLLLHAYPLSSLMWQDQVAALRGNYRVITVDFPGFGHSAPVREATIAGFARGALSVLDKLSVPEAAVVGLSMGGYVALSLYAQARGRVWALSLCDTKAGADSEEGKKGREATARAVEKEGVQALLPRMASKLVSSNASGELRAAVERMMLEASPEGAAAAQRAMATRSDSTSMLASISCPTLALVGRDDVLTPPSEAEAIARAVPGAELAIIEGAGHLANLEQPEAFNAALVGFLGKR